MHAACVLMPENGCMRSGLLALLFGAVGLAGCAPVSAESGAAASASGQGLWGAPCFGPLGEGLGCEHFVSGG